ncbi:MULTISPECIES: chemotaxis protein CheA [Halorubrum]|uniref:chemotaxis protein CheA n=1 Tax=Halorubrum TaxID=56688 RepID=UPI0010F6CE40|nr:MULTISPECIES: chemotaxis protein CheA [Halorubrum]MDB9251578.1 chemotaxis protein CheA [Halorubrum ezzemoulense]MDB9255987.1 chemotaxis protein CheA [Halorubrum ezzemoulense]MDB9276698.1 chemotaxis protein CheA [Halorubrum ezzemoulense]TKX67154.1 chemotaxis protein CheA [Halorubrum sp. GN12_10-3_MGM]
MDSHRAAFVAEAEDGITDLNNALLALEADPEDAEAMDDVFRVAHTLKGNAAAMGYEGVSDFGHALEDLLDAVRQGEREVTPELMDLLFEGVDTVEAMVDEIADTGEVSTDPSDLESRLREMEEHGTVGGSDAGGDGDSAGGAGDAAADEGDAGGDDDGGTEADADGEAPDISVPEPPAAADDLPDPVAYADVTIGEAQMPGVDAALVLQALDEQFDGHVTDPAPEALEDGEYDEGFDAFVGGADPEVVAEGLRALTQVEAVTAAAVGGGDAAEVESSDPDAESAAPEQSAAESGDAGPEPADPGDADSGEIDAEGAAEPAAADADDEPDQSDDDGEAEPSADDSSSPSDDSSSPSDDSSSPSDDSSSPSDDSGSAGGTDSKSGDEIKSIRVDVDQVDELYGLVEQLVTSRIKLRREIEGTDAESDALDELDKLASSLQDTAMDMRLIPFSQVSDSFPRLVRDISRDLDKRIDFEIEGDDVELDRTILTEMRDPLVHVLRNAVDHGIESPEEREAAGKDPTGHVSLTAERERDHVIIEVSDDGGGLDPDQLREKAVDEDVKSREAVEAMEDDEVYDLVFHPGFSTAEEVTDVSGRGVGMDVVRTTARDLDGSVSIESEPGEGSTVRFRLPVTVAIVKVMFVDVGGTEYGIPIKSIAEVARADDVEEVHGDEVVRHEDDLYPVVRLNERLGEIDPTAAERPTETPAADGGVAADEPGDDGFVPADPAAPDGSGEGPSDDGMLVRIREETRKVALHCDAVLDQEEVVVKPLDGPLSGTPGLSGTAVLGDGDVVAVLDVVSL